MTLDDLPTTIYGGGKPNKPAASPNLGSLRRA